MEQELKERLLDSGDQLIKWAEAAATKGGNFVQEQAPLLAEEIVKWNLFTGLAYIVISLLAAIGVVSFTIWAWRQSEDWPVDRRDLCPRDALRGATTIASLAAVAIGSMVFVNNLMLVIQATVAPRLLILETLHQVVK